MSKLQKMIHFRRGRHRLGEMINSITEDNWQDVHTPFDIATSMISMIDVQDKCFLILFNWEFVEVLIYDHNVKPSNIMFVCDTKTEQMYAEKVYKVNTHLMTLESVLNDGKIDMKLVSEHLKQAKEKLNESE